MIVIDTSAIIAILLNEDDAFTYAQLIGNDNSPAIAAPTLLETLIVMYH